MSVPSAPPNGPVTVARSALLTLTASSADHSLALRVARVSDHRPVAGPGRLTATLDGQSVPVAAQPNGSYLISMRGQSGGAHSLGVVVAHDGIRELLTGTVIVPQRRSALEFLQGHGMSAWWVLNIAVVLIAVLVISRRRH